MNKHRFLWLLSVLIALAVISSAALAAEPLQTPVAGSAIPQFAQPLPVLALPGTSGTMAVSDGSGPLTLRMCEFWAHVLPPGTFTAGEQPKTRVWGYIQGSACPPNGPDDPALDTYLGPVVLATRGIPTQMTFLNELGSTSTTQVLAYKYSTDQTLHWADPLNNGENMCNMMGGIPLFGSPCAAHYDGPIPAVPHLHGGMVPADLDGGPDAWFTSDGSHHGAGYYTKNASDPANGAVYTYPNTQQAAPLWFHDHTLGATRLNVYAGLAGAYLLADPNLKLPAGLAPYGLTRGGVLDATIPLVLQDRMFDSNGQLFFPGSRTDDAIDNPNPEHPYWTPEFIGDTIVVNGKAWPFLNVEPKRYRFLFLNGSNARGYEMSLVNQATGAKGPAMYVIGTDGGYLNAPAIINPARGQQLLMLPGERYDVIIDFSTVAPGTNLILSNDAGAPYPGGDPVDPATTARILQFRVGPCTSGQCGKADKSYNPASATNTIRNSSQDIERMVNGGKLIAGIKLADTRQLTLNEVIKNEEQAIDPVTGQETTFEGGPLEILVNNTRMDGISPDNINNTSTTRETEFPMEGTTEVWEIVNLTMDAHPIHLHLTQFQVMNRQAFDMEAYDTAYDSAFPGGQYIPAYGPPLNYNTGNPRALGGNPDVKPYLMGTPQLPKSYEIGWKDTVVAMPGMVTRIAVRFAPMDLPQSTPAASAYYSFDPSLGTGYVWHCHIIDHEDNEMMRPYSVLPNPNAVRTYIKGTDY